MILRIHERLKSFGENIPAVRTTVFFVRLLVTLEQGEVRTSIVAQGAWIWTNALVCVDVILEMMLRRSDECAFRTCHQSHPCDSPH